MKELPRSKIQAVEILQVCSNANWVTKLKQMEQTRLKMYDEFKSLKDTIHKL